MSTTTPTPSRPCSPGGVEFFNTKYWETVQKAQWGESTSDENPENNSQGTEPKTSQVAETVLSQTNTHTRDTRAEEYDRFVLCKDFSPIPSEDRPRFLYSPSAAGSKRAASPDQRAPFSHLTPSPIPSEDWPSFPDSACAAGSKRAASPNERDPFSRLDFSPIQMGFETPDATETSDANLGLSTNPNLQNPNTEEAHESQPNWDAPQSNNAALTFSINHTNVENSQPTEQDDFRWEDVFPTEMGSGAAARAGASNTLPTNNPVPSYDPNLQAPQLPTIPIKTFWSRQIQIFIKDSDNYHDTKKAAVFKKYNHSTQEMTILTEHREILSKPETQTYWPNEDSQNLFLFRQDNTNIFTLIKVLNNRTRHHEHLARFIKIQHAKTKDRIYLHRNTANNLLPLPKNLSDEISRHVEKISHGHSEKGRTIAISKIKKLFKTHLNLTLNNVEIPLSKSKQEKISVLGAEFILTP